MKKKLSNLRSLKNPKEYWKILNTNIDKQIYMTFTLFFKEWCNAYSMEHKSKNSILSDEELNLLADVQLNQMINQPITHEEVIKGISMLK